MRAPPPPPDRDTYRGKGGSDVPGLVIILLIFVIVGVVAHALLRERSRSCLAWTVTPSQLLTERVP